MHIPVIFEDEYLLAINKPPFVVVNRAESVKGETVQDWVEERNRGHVPSPRAQAEGTGDKDAMRESRIDSENQEENTTEFMSRAGIVHRIDKETSGILLIAKNADVFEDLQRQFKERLIKKVYLAIVHGRVTPSVGEVSVPVGRLPWNRERFGIVPGGKPAVTKFICLKSIVDARIGDTVSVLEVYPETGRTHQIRVHMKYINHPIVGDYLYAGRKVAKKDRRSISRVLLHAWKLTCTHPVTGKNLHIEAPIPDDMIESINGSL